MNLIRIGAFSGAIAVLLGAFGAHTLKNILEPLQLQSFETGVRYQFYHTLAIIFCGILYIKRPARIMRLAAGSFLAGIVLFSGSIYMLSTRQITGFEQVMWLGPVTPIGGLMFIAGWVMLAIGSGRSKM